jgi:hypothetical protein
MRHRVDKLALLALFALLVFVVHQYTRAGVATAKPANNVLGPVPSFTERGATKFDLLYREPDLALP